MSCKDCDHRHPHCHKDCPDYAEMQKILGETGASRRTAEEIYKRIQHS
jgi:hypothetical protein